MEFYFEELIEKDLTNGVHLSGIGGVGMSALAEILLDMNIPVQGSDTFESTNVKRLVKRGVKIFGSHKKEHIGNRLVCRSRAIKDDNEEIIYAKKTIFRSTLLAFLAKDKKHIVVTGSHGKTTVSTLLSHCLRFLGEDISFAVGGYSRSLDRFGRVGKSDYFVIEGDESDGSHLKTKPYGAILTSTDIDHLAFWKEGRNLQDSYVQFAKSVQNKDLFIFNGEDKFLVENKVQGKRYAETKDVEYNISISSLSLEKGEYLLNGQSVTVPMFGAYNCYNSAAVFGLLDSLGFEKKEIIKAIGSFSGVYRRMEYIGKNVYSDYAHHPEEVKAVFNTIQKLKQTYTVIFEPHRISRFKDELDGFCASLEGVYITDVFEASEGLNHDQTPYIEEFCKRTDSIFVPLEEIETIIHKERKPILMMGAGILDTKVRELLQST